MKLSQNTITVLKAFSTINSNLRVKDGNLLESIAVNKSILASANVEENFPAFAIYDLSEFLNVLSLFKDPDIEFEKGYLTLTEGRSSTKYLYADPVTFKINVPDKGITMPNPEITFDLTAEDLTSVLKASSALKLQKIAVTKGEKGLLIKAADGTNPATNSYSLEIDGDLPESEFNMIFKTENLKLINGDYLVEISSKKIAKLTHKEKDITYFLALEIESTFK